MARGVSLCALPGTSVHGLAESMKAPQVRGNAGVW
jgi:hypothetical protein